MLALPVFDALVLTVSCSQIPDGGCPHANLVTNRAAGLVDDEWEYLFAPYSAFTVRRTTWKAGTTADPHVIVSTIHTLIEICTA